MPSPFSPVHVAFVSGVRQDLGKLAQESPSQLRQAQNVLFTRKGHITGRPGLVSRNAQVQVAGAGGSLVAGLASIAGTTPAGLVATGFPAAGAPETPLIAWQGSSAYLRNGTWMASGPLWSVRQTKSAVFRTFDPVGSSRPSPIPVGQNLVGCVTAVGNQTGFPVLDSEGAVTGLLTTTLANFDSDANTCVAGNAIFFVEQASASVIGQIPGVLPNATQVTVGINCGQGINPEQGTSAVQDSAGAYYVAYKGTTGGTITIVRLTSAGAVTQTLTLTGLGTISCLALAYDPGTNRLGLVWRTITTVKTKVLTITAGVVADAALDVTLTGAALILQGVDPGTLAAGTTHNGLMSVMYDLGGASTASLYIGGRSYTAATESNRTQLNGFAGTTLYAWNPLFGAVTVAGRTLLGVMTAAGFSQNQASQWAVLDMSTLYTSGNTVDRTVVACGPFAGMARITPSAPYSDGTSVSFVIPEGLLFTESANDVITSVRRAVVRRITLKPQGIQAVHANGTTLMSGQLMHVFDGTSVRPDHFPEEAPIIFKDSAASSGGSLPAGSFSYQVTWESYSAASQTIRSGASNIFTTTVTAGQKVTVVVTKPQLWMNPTQLQFVRIRLWATQVNPTNNAPKYLAAEAVTNSPTFGSTASMVHTTQASGTEEQLYETVDTLADMRAPGADRGIAVVAERVWCADQSKLYVSKIIRPNVATSWNTEDTNVLPLPATLGTIQGLASVNQGLVVLCSRGAAVVTGPGVDDTGAGPGWVLQIIDGVPGMATSSPRSCSATSAGVAFQAQDGDLWLASSSGQAIPLSRPLRDIAVASSTIDVTNMIATPLSNAMIIAHGPGGVLRVLDLEMGQWGTWTFPFVTPTNGLFITAINGSLWLQTTSPDLVYSADNYASLNDAGLGAITALIETGILRQTNPTVHGWGRLRHVMLNEIRRSTDTQVNVNMQVLADQNDRVLMNKTLTTNPTNTAAFPGAGDGALTFGTTVQRCAYFRVLMSITPASFNVEGLDFWVANTGERAPSNNRS